MAKKTVRSTAKKVVAKVAASKEKNTSMAALAYVLFFIPLLIPGVKDDSFVKFHVKQSLVFLIASIGWSLAGNFFAYLPIVGWIVGGLVGTVISILLFIVWVKGLLAALGGREEELPVIGKYAKSFTF
jgi:uncharacterized membrane protein